MLAHKRLPCVDVGQREIGDEGPIALIVRAGFPQGCGVVVLPAPKRAPVVPTSIKG